MNRKTDTHNSLASFTNNYKLPLDIQKINNKLLLKTRS